MVLCILLWHIPLPEVICFEIFIFILKSFISEESFFLYINVKCNYFLNRKKTLKVLSRSVSVLRGNATRKGDDKKYCMSTTICKYSSFNLHYQYVVCFFNTGELSLEI